MKRERLVDIKDFQRCITRYDLSVTKKLYYRVHNWAQKAASPTAIFFSIFYFLLTTHLLQTARLGSDQQPSM